MKDDLLVKKRPIAFKGKLCRGTDLIGSKWTQCLPNPAQAPGRLAHLIAAAERKFEAVNPDAYVLKFDRPEGLSIFVRERIEAAMRGRFQWRRTDDIRIAWAAPVSGVSMRFADCAGSVTVGVVLIEGNPGTMQYFEGVFWTTVSTKPVVSPVWIFQE